MIRSELDAAGVTIRRCATPTNTAATLNAQHGRTFFLATRLLAPEQRPAVHALYGFARRADDILDDLRPTLRSAASAPTGCSAWPRSCSISLCSARTRRRSGAARRSCTPPRRYGIPWELFDDFLRRCGWT